MSIALRDGLIVGLIFGLIVGLIVGLIRLFTSEAIPETRFIVNQGTYRSVKMALIVGLIVGLIFVLIFGLSNGLRVGLPVGLIFGLSAGLLSGGLFAAKHYALRLFLWQTRSAPLNYVAFLNQAKDLLFLRQVGGGYIFTHRLLREYFASLPQAEKDAEPRAKAAPAV